MVLSNTSVYLCVGAMLVSAPLLAQEAAPKAEVTPTKQERYCASLPEAKRRTTEACKTEEERREDEYQRLVAERLEKEKATHSSFLKWLHFDGLWTPTTLGSSTFGLVGSHVTIANVGRVNFFGPPGVMLLLENTGHSRSIRPAVTWGISIYLTDFRMPGQDHTSQLFLNLAKAQTVGFEGGGLDLAGLSVTWKK